MATTDNSNNVTLFVYYKIPLNETAASLSAVEKVCQTIQSRYPYLKIQQQKRQHTDADNKETWLETYAGFSAAQLEKLIAELVELAAQNGLPKERRYEVFVTL